jgi:hypothetical protein
MKNLFKALLGVVGLAKAKFLQTGPIAPTETAAPDSLYKDTVPVAPPTSKSQTVQRNFVHLVGDFDRARVELDGRKVDLADLKKTPAHGGISDYFTLETAKTTYVLWNRPDAVQRAIQSGRKNHFDVADREVVRIGRDDTLVIEEKNVPVLKDAVGTLGASTQIWSAPVENAAQRLRETVQSRRATMPVLTPG